MDTSDTDSEQPTLEAFDSIIERLEPDEVETLQWLIDEIRSRFGASDSFDPNDSKFEDLIKSLAARVT